MEDYEKLGSFYLGRVYDLRKNEPTENLLLYDSKDLTTHAVCVGMTGSGKTGLCISLLEEAAIDGIPALVIDPKGDMTNLLLNFPNLTPGDFIPWVDESEANKKKMTVEEYAGKQSEMWKSGLQQWGQSEARIKRLIDAADFCIYTPGSTAGLPLSILKSFGAPPQEIIDEADAFNERVSTTATSLLGLIGIEADPIKSREHILISNIMSHYWQQQKDLDLSMLIQAIQAPPVAKIGVFDLETFYPPKERFELAMMLNNLLAAPGFQTWLQGDALDVNQLLYTAKGKPRVSIFYIAHLSDAERMFFVSLLLNQVLGWMRTQAGTNSLRAILYIDELFGYMPPVANPPSKVPLMTLLKQARAFGLGVVLATQNPVDLDYKGLSNTGTWFIGRLQTERDRDRVLDGLLSASEGDKFDRKTIEQMISQLGKRVFLLHNVHEEKPEIFLTRWAMSYLSGPLTRPQIKMLMEKRMKAESEISIPKPQQSPDVGVIQQLPTLGPDVTQFFMPIRSIKPQGAQILYRPYLWGSAKIHFIDKNKNVDLQQSVKLVTSIENKTIPVDWENSISTDVDESELLKKEEETARYETVPPSATKSKNYKDWENDFKDYLYRSQKVTLLKNPTLNETSSPGESERDFRIRLSQKAHEQRDEWTAALREKYAKKMTALEEKIRRAEEQITREQNQAQQQTLQTAISVGTTILGAFLGRKAIGRSTISRAGTAMSRAGRTFKERGDVARAKENLEILKQQLADLENEFQAEVNTQAEKIDVLHEALESVTIRPLKNNISIQLFGFVWVPHWSIAGGQLAIA